MLKKRHLLSIHNKVKSEIFAVKAAKGVTIFQASLIREETVSQISNKDNKHSTSHGSNHFCEGDATSKNDTLI